jgi:carbamoylphosphate synthase large subunit
MKVNSVLVLEAGGPASISAIKIIKKQLPEVRLIGCDVDTFAPGLAMCNEQEIVTAGNSPGFGSSIKTLIEKHSIDMVLPTFEHGFSQLAGISQAVITDISSALLCKDKLKFNHRCRQLGIPIPETHLITRDFEPKAYPQYVKPRFGVGSRQNYRIDDLSQLRAFKGFYPNHDQFISQTFISGVHWNVDVMVVRGEFIATIERKDIKQAHGNCMTVEVCSYPLLSRFAKKVQKLVSIESPFNLEVFEIAPGNFIVNEINVRFGGGIAFGAVVGRDFPSFLLTEDPKYLGEIKPQIISRFYQEIVLKYI